MIEQDDNETADVFYDEADTGPRPNQLVKRSFEGIATLQNNAATQALTAKATADINARWMIAMHRPRDLDNVRVALLRECTRPGFAKSAIYAVPRGTGTVRGLSIRFAETAMTAMGNIGCEAQTLYDSDADRVVRATVTDFESNSMWSRDLTIAKTKLVRKDPGPGKSLGMRLNSYGDTNWIVPCSDDDITTKESSAISKASRTGILRLIPAWLKSEAQEQCERVQRDAAAKDPDAERRKVFDAFASLNVKPSWLADWLGHPLDQATPSEIVDLQQLYRAIRDGGITLDEAMKAKRGGGDRPAATGAAAAVKPASSKPRQSNKAPDARPATPTMDEQAEIDRLERESSK
jgi:hypothetical protein